MNNENKFPTRKPTRAHGFDYSNGGAYFLTICTIGRKHLLSFIAPSDGLSTVGDDALGVPIPTLTEHGKIVEKYINSTNKIRGVNVDKYVIMPNHIHLILSIDDDGTPRASSPTRQTSTVSSCISSLKRFVNKEIGENIFQRSFYDRIIRSREEYNEIYNYIHLNPLNWEKDELFNDNIILKGNTK